ncbi:MAG: hypothetical protein IJ735_04705, partial [Clostridia bacterium]|nr:hypothetical protein [Clostridia bacterium]
RLFGRTCADCKTEEKVVYRDRMGEYALILKKTDGYCQYELRNSVLTNLGRSTVNNPLYLDFSGYTKKEVDTFFKKYFILCSDPVGYNHLLLSKGVE